MTHDEIEAAIERLDRLGSHGFIFDTDIVYAVNDSTDKFEVRNAIISLLKQADPDTRMILPVDADGERIHLGDELCGYGRPDGGVYCQAIVSESIILVGETSIAYKDWLLWNATDCNHRKSTVEDVLHEFATKIFATKIFPTDDNDKFTMEKVAEYADKLRKVMGNDDQ